MNQFPDFLKSTDSSHSWENMALLSSAPASDLALSTPPSSVGLARGFQMAIQVKAKNGEKIYISGS